MPPSLPSDSGGEEPTFDDFIGPDDEFRAPLPPEDRIWRHPSEVAAAARSRPDAVATRPTGRVLVATVAVSALIGATLSLGIVAALGGFEERVVERRIAVDVGTREPSRANLAAADATTSVVGLAVRVGDRWSTVNGLTLRSDGVVVTTNGALADAEEIEARLPDGTVVEAEVVGSDVSTDVAVVRVGAGDLVPAVIGSSADLGVGDDVMALGLGGSGNRDPILTTCVVQAVGQRVSGRDATLHDVILIDSPTPQELAGAPVLDPDGAVVGLLASPGLADDHGGSVVIPIDDAVHVADEILVHGRARHVWLGVGGHDLTRSEARQLGIDGGATISTVYPDSPAERSGIEPGEVIVSVDGVAVTSMSDLVVELRDHEPGEQVELVVVGAGETRTVSTHLADRSG